MAVLAPVVVLVAAPVAVAVLVAVLVAVPVPVMVVMQATVSSRHHRGRCQSEPWPCRDRTGRLEVPQARPVALPLSPSSTEGAAVKLLFLFFLPAVSDTNSWLK